MQEDYDIEVNWLGFELHPETPPGGKSLEALLGKTRTEEFMIYMKRFASGFDVEISLPTGVPNTRRALAMTEYARDNGKLEVFRDATMDAHWLERKDIESDGDLLGVAESAGLDPTVALSAADDQFYLDRIESIRKTAKENHITSIPVFVFGDARLVGCQSYDKLRKMISRH